MANIFATRPYAQKTEGIRLAGPPNLQGRDWTYWR